MRVQGVLNPLHHNSSKPKQIFAYEWSTSLKLQQQFISENMIIPNLI